MSRFSNMFGTPSIQWLIMQTFINQVCLNHFSGGYRVSKLLRGVKVGKAPIFSYRGSHLDWLGVYGVRLIYVEQKYCWLHIGKT